MNTAFSDIYLPIKAIGSGNSSEVWLAQHRILNTFVAIKVVNINSEYKKQKFIKEIQILSQINSNFIIKIYDAQILSQTGLIITEYINGQTINKLDLVSLSWLDKLKLSHNILLAIKNLQDNNIIHNDLSIKNIIVDKNLNAKLLDFGCASKIDSDNIRCLKQIRGTIDWVCPEYCLDSKINDYSTDIYSTGAILYYILTGHKLYPDSTVQQKITWKKNYSPTHLDINAWTHPNTIIRQHIKQMLHNRKHRTQDIQLFISQIKSILIQHVLHKDIEKLYDQQK